MDVLLATHRLLTLAALALFTARVASVRVVSLRRGERRPRVAVSLRMFALTIAAGFLVTALWQGFWTFRADDHPRFASVARLDRRQWEPEVVARRRAVVDRRGEHLIDVVEVDGEWRRSYPLGPAAAHLTGYHDARFGKAGAEAALDAALDTWRTPAWRVIDERLSGLAGETGAQVTLTLDARLQTVAAEALAGEAGAAVVLRPASGEVLALASAPAFDPNTVTEEAFATLNADPRSPLLNRALAGLYPPGSTFKPLLAAGALSAGWSADERFEARPEGYLPPFDSKRIQDHEAHTPGWAGHGTLTMDRALAVSANGYFAWLGVELGDEVVVETARAFGLSRGWSLLSGEADSDGLHSEPGRLPEPPLKPADTARLAIGQDKMLVTPLALAVAMGTLANHGRLMPPRLRLDPDAEPPAGTPIVDAAVAEQVRTMMAGAVSAPGGTAAGLRGLPFSVAAKTGSAENPHGRAHAWLAAMAPAEQPAVVVVVLVENGGSGSHAALPIARRLLQTADEAGWLGAEGGAAP